MPSAAALHHLRLLADEAGLDLPTLQWPLPEAAVVDALARLPSDLSPALAGARDDVLAELQASRPARGTLALHMPGERLAGFADDATPGSSLALQTAVLGNGALAVRAAVRVERAGDGSQAVWRLDGSAVAAEALGLLWQAGPRRHWWGPGWQSSLVLSQNAPSLMGIGVQRASATPSRSPWLAWLGPWNLELFIAGLEGTHQPERPWLIGNRLTFRPHSHVELGLTRTAQWGGRGRDESGRSLADVLLGHGMNADTPEAARRDPGNAMGGFDLRLRCPAGGRCAAYLQGIGEDEAGNLPSRYLGLYGLEAWTADGRQRVFAELLESGCGMPIGQTFVAGCAYRNHGYPEGYVHRGRWLGAAAGPDSRLLTVGWLDASRAASVRVHHGSVGWTLGTHGAFARGGRLQGLAVRRDVKQGAVTLSPELTWLRIGAQRDWRLGMTLRFAASALD